MNYGRYPYGLFISSHPPLMEKSPTLLKTNIGSNFICGLDQLFYVSGDWVEAQAIECGKKLFSAHSDTIVQDVQKQDGFVDLYAITVESNENFFISDENILVHNLAFCIPLITWTIGEGIAILEGLTIAAAATAVVATAISVAVGDNVDLSDFDIKLKGGQGTKASRGKFEGWEIEKDTASHAGKFNSAGGKVWKLKDKKGDRIASLDKNGKVISK